jgi:hypothetical protein
MALFKKGQLLTMTLTETVSVSFICCMKGKNIQVSPTTSNDLINGVEQKLQLAFTRLRPSPHAAPTSSHQD